MSDHKPSYVRSAAFSTGMILVTIVIPTLLLLARAIPYRARYQFASYWSQFVIWWLKVTCSVDYQLKGRKNIPDHPVVVLCKHQSTWETIFLTLLFRPQVWVLKREILWVPFFGWGISVLNPIAIDRGSRRQAMRQVLSEGKSRLQGGAHVIVFPEGTRVPPGQRGRYGSGGVRLAREAGVQVVPVAHNAGHFWRRKGFLKQPGTIQIVIGEPLDTQGKSVEEILKEVEQWIETTVETLGNGDQASPK